jgi:alanine racemase
MGHITMDSFVLDITKVTKNLLEEGDYLCLLDNSNIKELLKGLNLISYELLTLMGSRLIREYK